MGRLQRHKINKRLRKPVQSECIGMEPVIEPRWIDGQRIDVKVYPYALDWHREHEKQSGDTDDNS